VLFECSQDSSHLAFSPLARTDLDSAVENLIGNHVQFTVWSEQFGTDAVMAYAGNADPTATDDLAKFLLSEDSSLPTVLAIVQVPEVTSGAGWWTVYQQSELSAPHSGMVSEITGSAALQQMILDTGQLPALSRDELEARLDSTTGKQNGGHGQDEHMDMSRTAFCDRRSRPGTDRMSSGGLRAQPHFHFPTPSRRQGHQWLESGGSVIPLRVSSGLSPDSCAGVSPSNLTTAY